MRWRVSAGIHPYILLSKPPYKRYDPDCVCYDPSPVPISSTKLRADHCSNRFQFVDPLTGAPINIDTHHPYVPPVFVIQIQIPSDPPSGFFSSAEDGPGWAILMYYKITEVRDVCV